MFWGKFTPLRLPITIQVIHLLPKFASKFAWCLKFFVDDQPGYLLPAAATIYTGFLWIQFQTKKIQSAAASYDYAQNPVPAQISGKSQIVGVTSVNAKTSDIIIDCTVEVIQQQVSNVRTRHRPLWQMAIEGTECGHCLRRLLSEAVFHKVIIEQLVTERRKKVTDIQLQHHRGIEMPARIVGNASSADKRSRTFRHSLRQQVMQNAPLNQLKPFGGCFDSPHLSVALGNRVNAVRILDCGRLPTQKLERQAELFRHLIRVYVIDLSHHDSKKSTFATPNARIQREAVFPPIRTGRQRNRRADKPC